jgi:hypothetical protein
LTLCLYRNSTERYLPSHVRAPFAAFSLDLKEGRKRENQDNRDNQAVHRAPRGSIGYRFSRLTGTIFENTNKPLLEMVPSRAPDVGQ